MTGLSWERTCLISSSLLSVGSGLVSCLEGPAASQEGRGESSSLLSSMIMVVFLLATANKSPGRLTRGISSSLLDIIQQKLISKLIWEVIKGINSSVIYL